jgi:hypothetical protein
MIRNVQTVTANVHASRQQGAASSLCMQVLRMLLCALCCATLGCSSASLHKSPRFDISMKKKIAVVPSPSTLKENFWTIVVGGILTKHHKLSVANYLETELISLDTYIVVERGELDSVLKEHSLSLSGLIEKGDYKTIGRLTGLDAIVVVKDGMEDFVWIFLVGFYGDAATAKMIDVNSGEIIWSAEGSVSYVTVIPLLPVGFNAPHTIAKAIVRELKTQR